MRLKGRRGRMGRSCLGWLLGVVGALLLIAGILAYLVLAPVAPRPGGAGASAGGGSAVAGVPGSRPGGVVPGGGAAPGVPPLGRGQIQYSVTQAQLDQQLRQAVAGRVQDPALTLEPGVIIFTGRPTEGRLTVAARIELEPFAEGGKIKVKVRKATLGRLPLPAALSNMLAQQVEQMLAAQQAKQKGLVVDSVQVSAGALTVLGHLQSQG